MDTGISYGNSVCTQAVNRVFEEIQGAEKIRTLGLAFYPKVVFRSVQTPSL